MFRRALLVLSRSPCLSSQASAQLTVQILQAAWRSPCRSPSCRSPGMRPGQTPWDVAATVQADLERSGRFRPLPRAQLRRAAARASEVDTADWRMLKVDYVLVGRLSPMPDGRYRSAL